MSANDVVLLHAIEEVGKRICKGRRDYDESDMNCPVRLLKDPPTPICPSCEEIATDVVMMIKRRRLLES